MQATDKTPLFTNQLLAKFAEPDYQASLGEWDETTRALLATAIPEMAAELLQRRNDLCIAIHPEAAKQSLLRARDILRSPDPIPPRSLALACRSLRNHSPCPDERAAAQQALTEMEVA